MRLLKTLREREAAGFGKSAGIYRGALYAIIAPMDRVLPFSETLVKARRGQGFSNAHSFFLSRGGRRALGLSYPNYLALEKGRSLPKGPRLAAILKALDAPPSVRRELVRAYVAELLGTDALLRDLEEPSRPSDEPPTSDEAARQALRQRAAQLGLEQWRVLAADPAAYLCHVYLVNTPGWNSHAEIARAAGIEPAKARAVLKALDKARIVELSGDRARSPFAYKFLQALPLLPTTAHLKAPILKAREGFAAARSAKRHNVTTRMTAANLDRYFARLHETVNLAGIYGDAEKSSDSDVYFVDARVCRLFD